MVTFIDDVLIDIQENGLNFSDLTFVLPSKRAGNFLKRSLSKLSNKTLFSPEILSVEEFVEGISLLKTISNAELLFQLYDVYQSITPKDNLDEFDAFCKWAQIIIQDFNEIDRYLIPEDKIFNYLKAIKDVDHWSLNDKKTDLVKNYLSFWETLPQLYNGLKDKLINNGVGYQGLLYREAVNKLELYIQHNPKKQHVFLGFNALNNSEQIIIQELLQHDLAKIYWDIDKTFLNSKYHDAGLFFRKHSQWNYFNKHPFKWEHNHYRSKKNINSVGIPKNIGQAKYAGELLKQIISSQGSLDKTALVLGDESLITPILNSIPAQVSAFNITMGMPLKLVPLAPLFESLFHLHKTTNKTKIYYKEVVSIISNPFVKPILDVGLKENTSEFIRQIKDNNITFIALHKLRDFFSTQLNLIELLFGDWKNDSVLALKNCKEIIQHIKSDLDKDLSNNLLSLEYLYKFNQTFNQINTLLATHSFVTNIKTLFGLYREILSSETMDFQGEPLRGLQIIGMLESRVIDFETVIITTVNEGVLPSGKSNNSFIPFDVKLEYGLPTYKEKDAVYTYHFYHLLQRAKNIYILHNTEVDALKGGEKSRFITQLEAEGVHKISHFTVLPEVPVIQKSLKHIKKTSTITKKLQEVAFNGFSPSALTSYIRNPIDFYSQKILHINAFEDVEETVAANTFGNIIHKILEELYKPFVSQFLTVDAIKDMKAKSDVLAHQFFKEEYKDGVYDTGKNLIAFEIIKRYVGNFLDMEMDSIQQGKQIKIIALEKKLKEKIDISELSFPVYLKGTIDRVDEYDGVTRIIDYKTGRVDQSKVSLVNWEDLTTDYDACSKSFQILTYAYLMYHSKSFTRPVEAGIISFKNLKPGFLRFTKKEALRGGEKSTEITQEVLDFYFDELKKLILEICNASFDFIEKEV